jgi:gluconolactonase
MFVEAVAPELERLISSDVQVERIPADCIFAEGPLWNARESYFLWADIVGDKILQWTPGKGISVFLKPSGKANGLTYDRQGRLLVAGWGSRSVWRLEPDGSITTLASHYQGRRINTPNDIVVKSDGAIYWTDPTGALFIPGMCGEDVQQYLPFQGVYRLSPDGSTVTAIVDDGENPNGLAFSPDESLLYVNDTTRRHIRVFDVQPDGSVQNGRLFYQDTGDEPGNPDGMKVDSEGNVYCTGAGGVRIISPAGKLLGTIKLHPVTNMAWGDADWKTLYVTGRSEVYRVRCNVPGIPV